jgi:GalNAc-alpha-(1->4)-GalNAc-alpha-(1->3)-diNAcBac-PP-undecaprenol alpha-1,4-N-acetyl-D-galactosaminyltransferase
MTGGNSRRLVLVTSCLGGGGAERIVATMAAYWAHAGHEVHVVALRADEKGPAYTFPATVRIHRLRLIVEHNAVFDIRHIGRLWRLRRLLVGIRPALVLSFIDKLNVAVLLSLAGTRIPVVATEHLVPWMNPLGPVWERLRAAVYPRARAVVSPTQAMSDWFKAHYAGNFLTMPSPGHYEIAPVTTENHLPVIFSAGRLAREKGYDLLLSAFADVSAKRKGWRLEIAGEGPEMSALTEQIEALGLQSQVSLLGHVSDVAARMRSAELFVLSSRQEAYPMVLCEAMAAGMAIIATDCPAGPREIIEDGKDGLLVPPEVPAALGSAIIQLIDDAPRRRRLGAAARMKAPQLAAAHAMLAWDQLLTSMDGRRA